MNQVVEGARERPIITYHYINIYLEQLPTHYIEYRAVGNQYKER